MLRLIRIFVVCYSVLCCCLSVVAFDENIPTDVDGILQRLSQLEARQIGSEHEIAQLKGVIASQNSLIDSQARQLQAQDERIQQLEKYLTHDEHDTSAHNIETRPDHLVADHDHHPNIRPLDSVTERRDHNKSKTSHSFPSTKHVHKPVDTPLESEQPRVKDSISNTRNIPTSQTGVSKRLLSSVTNTAGPAIAFTAFLDQDFDYGTDQTLKFNQIITNEGDGYNVHTGVFTCPTAGLYLFSFTIGQRHETSQSEAWVYLKINSVNVVDGVTDVRDVSQDAQGGNMAVVRAQKGDAVWISVNNGHVEGSNSSRFTTFTGLYLAP